MGIIVDGIDVNKTKLKMYSWSYTLNYPFTLYYTHDKHRVILTDSMASHNAGWIDLLRSTDILICSLPWHFDYKFFQMESFIFDKLNIQKSNVYLLCNTIEDKKMASSFGFNAWYINQNCLLDESQFYIIHSDEKKYNAVYNARLDLFKRHKLAVNIDKLALVEGFRFEGGKYTDIKDIPHVYRNEKRLNIEELISLYSKTKVGLCLSEIEGACFASTEYLLCGLPVVSTKSLGGRDVWYNEYNSIICDSDPESVSNAVYEMIEKNPNPEIIREECISKIFNFRKVFCEMLNGIFDNIQTKENAFDFFKSNFSNKFVMKYVDKEYVVKTLNET